MKANGKRGRADLIKGTLIAGACGDAFGMPYEGLSKHQMEAHYGRFTPKYRDSEHSRHTKGLPKGSFTDDTQLTLATVEAILDFDYEKEVSEKFEEMSYLFGNHILAERIGHHMAKLYQNRELVGAGRATKLSLKRILQGTPPLEAGQKDSFGCGAAMRISPIALLPFDHLNDQGRSVLEITTFVTRLTHNSPVGFNSAFLVSGVIGSLLNATELEDPVALLKRVGKGAADFGDEPSFSLRDKILKNADDFHKPIDELATQIGTSGLATESVVMALFAFLKEPHGFEALMCACVRNGGDTDSIASIAGNFFGALNGFSEIPIKYVINVQDSQGIQALVDRFADLMDD